MSSSTSRTLRMVVCAVSVVGCTPDQVSTPLSTASIRAESRTVHPQSIRPEEAVLFQLESKDDGFGGFYVSRDGIVHLFSRYPERQEQLRGAWRAVAKAAFRETLGASQSEGSAVVIERGSFNISELAAYRDRIFDAVNAGQFPSAVSLDLSEQTNRVALGIVSDAERGAARELLQKLMIPETSVTLRVESRARDATVAASRFYVPPSILDEAETIVGGLGVSWNAVGSTEHWACNIAFIARTGSATRAVTASHCSSLIWGVDGSIMKNAPAGRPIAYESDDPVGYICGIHTCRGSDAAMFTLYSGIASERGLIAKTSGLWSLSWDTTTPYWTITDVERSNMYYGLGLYKQGRVTGLTYGYVTDTCYDFWVSSSMVRTCQTVADAPLERGDSGGSVFFPNGRTATSITLAGIVSAKLDGSGKMVFSPFQRVAANLGLTEWDVRHPSSYPSTPSLSASVVSGHPQLSWAPAAGAVNYYVYRSWINYSTLDQSNGFEFVGSATSPMNDTMFDVTAATGSTVPGLSSPGYVGYYIVAVDSYGATSLQSGYQYFRLAP